MISDAMHYKSLRPDYRNAMARRRRARIKALEHLAYVVRQNIGRKVTRGSNPSPQTQRIDAIRDALAAIDTITNEGRDHEKEDRTKD